MNSLKSNEGFTLIEIIAVLIILGILAAVAVPRYIDLEQNASARAIDAGISELNGRESLVWADSKISQTGYVDDTAIQNDIDYALGDNYSWVGGNPQQTGATLKFKQIETALTRIPSTDIQPAVWKRPTP